MLKKEKKLAKGQTYLPHSLWQQLELFAAQDNVRSMSEFLHRALDEYATLRIAKQKVERRFGNQ